MSSVGSLSSSTSTSIRGYGGLASGLDRDELIKGMTIATTNKITQQEQKKQQLQWKQEAVQSISSSMIDFHSKYTETLTSPTNLFSSMLWGRNKITASGTNSKYVSVTGTASSADALTIMGVKKRAQNATWTSTKMASDLKLSSGAIDAKADTFAALNGKTLEFSYDGKDYTVNISGSDAKLQDSTQAAEIIQNALKSIEINGSKTDHLGDHIKVEGGSGGFTFSTADSDKTIKLTGGSALQLMGIEAGKDGKELTTSNSINSENFDQGTLTRKWSDMFKGQTLTFSYNGTSATVSLPETPTTLEDVRKTLQDSLDAKFGKGRVSVEIEPEKTGSAKQKLVFKTTVPGAKNEDGSSVLDDSSVLKLTGGGSDALKALGLATGSSNRVNMDAKLSEYGFEKTVKNIDGKEVSGYKIQINGKSIEVQGENATVKDLMNAINKSDVSVSYQEVADKFIFTAKENGASGTINFKGNSSANVTALQNLFGIDANEEEKHGEDAIVTVKYAGSDEEVDLRRGTNTFTIDGLTIGIKGEFGYERNEDGTIKEKDGKAVKDKSSDPVEITASVDVDKVYDTIKSFVDSYNAIVDQVNTELTTKHEKDYDPLTSDQKSQLSDDEVEKWEAKAKEGLLYADSDLRSLSMDLRVVVSGGLLEKFKDIGITVSSTYSDNGKLSIDESKLRGALETDPESVEKLFTSEEGVDANGDPTFNGLATNLKSVMNKYVNTMGAMESKGILIRKAGSKSSALSLTQNTYYDQLKSIDEVLEKLKDKLKAEQDRYISQFSTLETLIANMNSQSSYLSSMSGY